VTLVDQVRQRGATRFLTKGGGREGWDANEQGGKKWEVTGSLGLGDREIYRGWGKVMSKGGCEPELRNYFR